MKKFIFITILMIIFTNLCHAFDLDMTVDDEIRKNYDSSKLMKDTNTEESDESLPELPSFLKTNTTVTSTPKQGHAQNTTKPIYNLNEKLKISSGTSFDVVSVTKVNDWLSKGSTVKFCNKSPIVKKNYVIPANTEFYGTVMDVHQPQISCNGGLVVIRLQSMVYKGHTIPINAYVTRADGKKIFLNNIKGERKYLKTMWQKGNWGRTIFNKMLTLTINLGGEGSTILLSPFPFAYGSICLGLNTITSPICAFFKKGGHVSIPSGSQFRLKFTDDVSIN